MAKGDSMQKPPETPGMGEGIAPGMGGVKSINFHAPNSPMPGNNWGITGGANTGSQLGMQPSPNFQMPGIQSPGMQQQDNQTMGGRFNGGGNGMPRGMDFSQGSQQQQGIAPIEPNEFIRRLMMSRGM